jgi:hypothetical protein
VYKANNVNFSVKDIITVRVALSYQRKDFIRNWLDTYKYNTDVSDYWARRIQEINDSEAAIYKF